MPICFSLRRFALAFLAATGGLYAAGAQPAKRPALRTPAPQVAEKIDPAEQWPDFRGPGGDGISRGKGIPLEWSETQNVRWKIPMHGLAWSSPVVWGRQVWLTTATPDGKEMSVLCVDRTTGKVLLDRVLFTNATVEERQQANTYASPSPVIEAGRVYFHFGKYGTACLDTATFKTLWERRDLLCTHAVGPGSSPVLFRNLLVLTYDGTDQQYLAALDKKTGKTVWNRPRSADFTGVDPDQRKAFSTPFVTTWAGKTVLLSCGARAAYAYDPVTGEELWKVTYKGFSNASRPVAGGGLTYLNTGYARADLLVVRLGGSGDVTGSQMAWQTSKNVPLNSSPLLLDGLLYLVSSGGIVSCLDAKTGDELWKDRLIPPFSSCPVLIEGRIFVFNESGKGYVLEPGRQFKKVAENQLDDGLMGSPAVVGRSLILRTKSHLYCIEATSGTKQP